LDGDVDFKPEAVLLLVDRMRKNPKVAAACGRIHPTGDGINELILLKIPKIFT
jgi:chitin synthase